MAERRRSLPRRGLDLVLINVLGVLIMVYFVFKFALLAALWIVFGPLAFIAQLFGSDMVFNWLDAFFDKVDSGASWLHDRVERVFGLPSEL